ALGRWGGAAPAILGVGGMAFAPAERRAWVAAGGAAAKDREAAAHAAAAAAPGRGTLRNRRKKLSVVCRASSSKETALVSARTLAVSTTKAGSLRLPRCRPGAR